VLELPPLTQLGMLAVLSRGDGAGDRLGHGGGAFDLELVGLSFQAGDFGLPLIARSGDGALMLGAGGAWFRLPEHV